MHTIGNKVLDIVYSCAIIYVQSIRSTYQPPTRAQQQLGLGPNIMPERIWHGDPPEGCDLCSRLLKDTFYDVSIPTLGGTWGFLCLSCFSHTHASLGIGRGQKYERSPSGEFMCVAGGSEDESTSETPAVS